MNWLVFVVAFVCVLAGYALEVFLGRRLRASRENKEETDASPDADEPAPGLDQMDSEQAQQFLKKLLELASSVDGEVDRHSTRIAQISRELKDGSQIDAKSVLAAAGRLIEANETLRTDLNSAKSKIQTQQQELETYMAEVRTDVLTGVGNRRAFEEELKRRFSQWERQGTTMSLLLADVDHFKRFNDYHGHQAGDEVLRGVARVLSETLRDMDTVSRYGGEEFAIILPGSDLEGGKHTAERLREAVAHERFPVGDAELRVTTSVGLAEIVPGEQPEGLIKRADAALYAAKQGGRNCSYLHDGEANRRIAAKAAFDEEDALLPSGSLRG